VLFVEFSFREKKLGRCIVEGSLMGKGWEDFKFGGGKFPPRSPEIYSD